MPFFRRRRIRERTPSATDGTTDAPVVAVDIGKFGTAYSWMPAVDSIPSVGTLDKHQPGEEPHHKSPNSVLILAEYGTDGKMRDSDEVVLGNMADTRNGKGDYPPGSQLFRRFGRQRRRSESLGLFLDSGTGTSVKSSIQSSSRSEFPEMELSGILFHLLVHVKDAALKNLDATAAGVKWVLTVPASSSEQNQLDMRNIAAMASLVVDGGDAEGLVLCPEPIAACFAFQDDLGWEMNDTYLVVDCGGVTVDISAVQVCNAKRRELRHLHEVQSGPWGSENVDAQFSFVLEGFIRSAAAASDAGTLSIESFLKSSAMFRIMQDWEKAKTSWHKDGECRFDLRDLRRYPLAVKMEGMDRARNLKNVNGEIVGGYGTWDLVLTPAWMEKTFQQQIERIQQATFEQLNKPELQGITSVVMVGGFSSNILVQEAVQTCVRAKHPDIRVLIHPRPSLAIAQGAAYFGRKGSVQNPRQEDDVASNHESSSRPEARVDDSRETPNGCLWPEGDSVCDRFDRMKVTGKSEGTLPSQERTSAAGTSTEELPIFEACKEDRITQVDATSRCRQTNPIAFGLASMIQELAEASNVPVISQAASSVMKLLSMLEKRRETSEKATSLFNRCTKLTYMLKAAESVLQQEAAGRFGHPVRVAIHDLVEVIETFNKKSYFIQLFVSRMFTKRFEEAESAVEKAKTDLSLYLMIQNVQESQEERRSRHRQPSEESAAPVLVESLAQARRNRRDGNLKGVEISDDDIHIDFTCKLGEGGFGKVYVADYMRRNVAVKVLEPNYGSDCAEDERRRFLQEADIMFQLHSPHIVEFFGVITSRKDRLVLVMELLPGGDLRSFLDETTQPLGEEEVRRITVDICAGLAFLHEKGMIHGDLKSPNVLFDRDGNAKIGDFGTARFETCTGLKTGLVTHAASNSRQMSERWAAPEVLNESEKFGTRESDVFSFGIVAWEVLSREIPWKAVSLSKQILLVVSGHRPEIPTGAPAGIVKIVESCWDQSPGRRPTCAQIKNLL